MADELFHMSRVEMAILRKFQDKVHQVDPKVPTERDPRKKEHFRKETMQYRDEFRAGRIELLMIRRAKLKRLYIADVKEQMRLMRHLGYDWIPTQP